MYEEKRDELTFQQRYLKELRKNGRKIKSTPFKYGTVYSVDGITDFMISRLVHQVELIVRNIASWSCLNQVENFDVFIDSNQFIPLAYSTTHKPFIVIPQRIIFEISNSDLCSDLVHEIAHLFLFSKHSLFLSEGWAVACSYTLSNSTSFPFVQPKKGVAIHNILVKYSEQANRVIDYLNGESEELFQFNLNELPNEQTRVIYAIAGSFALYLIENFKFQNLFELINSLCEEIKIENLFREIYGMELFEIVKRWFGVCGISQNYYTQNNEPCEVFPLQLGGWLLKTDQEIGGDSVGEFTQIENGVSVSGSMGNRGSYHIVLVSKYCTVDKQPVDIVDYDGIRFNALGDGKNYQTYFVTDTETLPGQEFMYAIELRRNWVQYDIPFDKFQSFTASGGLKENSHKIFAFVIRLFGYRKQSFEFSISNIEFYKK